MDLPFPISVHRPNISRWRRDENTLLMHVHDTTILSGVHSSKACRLQRLFIFDTALEKWFSERSELTGRPLRLQRNEERTGPKASPSNVTRLFRYLVPLRVKRAYSLTEKTKEHLPLSVEMPYQCYKVITVPGTIASGASLLRQPDRGINCEVDHLY